MSNVKIFIGADSGMMHLANSSNVTTIGLFNVTEPEFYGVYGKKNININTNDKDIVQLIKKMIKQRNESIEVYKKNSRDDLLKIEQNEVDILSGYLPKQFSEEETKKLCSSLVSKLEVKSMKDMGKIMGELKKNHSDSIDSVSYTHLTLPTKRIV